MMTRLAEKKCPCDEATKPVMADTRADYLRQLHRNWEITPAGRLKREWSFKDFRSALEFTRQIGELAEAVAHHPDIWLSWGRVKVEIFTHKINDLTENDFVLAAKIDQL